MTDADDGTMEWLRAEHRRTLRKNNIDELARELDPMAFDEWSDEDMKRRARTHAQGVVDSEWLRALLQEAERAAFERARHLIAVEALRPVNAPKNPYDTPTNGGSGNE